MTTVTDFIEVNPVIPVGFEGPSNEFVIMPFYHVLLHKGGIVKKVLVNYTFVKPNGEFENELGAMKKHLFESILPKKEVKHYFLHGRNADDIESMILRTLWESENGDYLMFAWERKFGDDQPFFKGLGIIVDGEVSRMTTPVTLSSLGMKVHGIFKEISNVEWKRILTGKGQQRKG